MAVDFVGRSQLTASLSGPIATSLPARIGCLALRYCRPAFKREDQVFRMELELFETNFFELFVIAEVGFLNQFFQALSVATMFGMQAIDLSTQRRIL
jgi:hypothetical protein